MRSPCSLYSLHRCWSLSRSDSTDICTLRNYPGLGSHRSRPLRSLSTADGPHSGPRQMSHCSQKRRSTMKTPSLWMVATSCFIALTSAAQARSAYDGSWDLVFVTQRGACEPSYNFTVNVSDGIVSHPNLLKFR